MICRFCGSESLVWDHLSGYIVCSTCGSVVEHLLDDAATPRGAGVSLRIPVRSRGARLLGGVSGVDRLSLISSVVNARALEALSKYPVVMLALELVDSNPLLKARTLRGRVALALYAIYRAMGCSKSKSRVLASRASRVSPRTIERVGRGSRSALAELEAKARELVEKLASEGRLSKVPLLYS